MKTQSKLEVVLGHRSNPDIPGYWQDPVDSGKPRRVEVASLAEASKVCTAFIERNGLGGGNWTGGDVYDGKRRIAWVSFNGRVWDPSGKTEVR